jgi:hypothetical protein
MRNIISLLLLGIYLCGCSTSPVDHSREFMKNAYSGKTMRAEEWLTGEARSQRLFNTFGGLDALVKDSYAEATRNQGLKSVTVLSVNKHDDIYTIETEVVFNNKVTSNSKEDWIMEDGKWKIKFTDPKL